MSLIMSLMLFIVSCPKETMTFGLFVMQNIEDFHKMLLLTLHRIAQKWPIIMTLLMTWQLNLVSGHSRYISISVQEELY